MATKYIKESLQDNLVILLDLARKEFVICYPLAFCNVLTGCEFSTLIMAYYKPPQ